MNVIQKLKQARNIDELATEIEPLAQALAGLVDETNQAIEAQKTNSLKQAEEWIQCQKQTAEAWQQSAKDMREAAKELDMAAVKARTAASNWTLNLWLGVIAASTLPILVLLTVSWLCLEPQVTTQNGTTWLVMKLSESPAPLTEPTSPPKGKSKR